MSVEPNKASWLVGSGEGMAARIRAHDWSATPLGPIDAWPPGLRVAVNLMLTNGFPVAIAWGPGAIVLYNDGYAGIIGTRHPDALGQSVHTVFPEVRDAYGPVLDCVWQGETVTQYDQPYRLWRNGRLDEAWFTVSYSPLRDEQGQVSGVLRTLFETTARLLAERRHDDMERELRERESRYHTLFDAMEEGVGIIERIESAPGQLTNFRCVLGNPVFARLSGVDDAVGKTMRDVLPGEPEAWFETYETVLRTGEPARFERDLVTIGRTVDVYAFRIDDGTQRRVAIVIRDITARQRGEAERERLLLEVEYERARQAFLLKLSDALRPLADPGAIQAEANRILGEHLQVDRAFYVEVDMVNQVSIVEQDCVRGNVPSLAERHALVHYGPVVDVMREGRPLVVEDVETAPMILESQRPAYAALPIRSFMAVPIIKHGDYVAVMATTDVNLRAWTAEDLTLLQDVAERTWEAVERSRAEAAARESEERQAFLLSLSDALRPLADPGAIQSTALHLLGEHLGVDRAFYAEIVTDGGIDYYRLDRDYHTPRTPSIVGRHPVSAFGRVVVDTYRAGHWMAVSDVETDEALAPADRQAFAAIGVCAFIGVPLIKDGSFVATLGVNQFEARAWQPAEVVLVEAVAERTWAAVERARAEEALRQSEERLQKAMSTDTVGVLFFDLHGHFADANETFERMSGYTREELCESVHWTALTPPEFMDLTERMVDDLAAYGKAPPYEKQMIRKDGSRWWGLFAPTRLSGTGRESRCVEFIIDITARKRAEAALGESEERYRTLFESIDQGFCTIEVLFDEVGKPADYRFLEINPAFARNSGFDDPVGKRMRELRPGQEQFWFDTYGRIARTGVAERFEEHAHELGRWFNVYAYRVGTPEQHRVAVLFEDITGRKQAELAIQESRAEFERQAQFLDATLSNVGDYVSIWDHQARFVYANRALERLWGRTRLTYAGRSTAELGYTPDQVTFFEKAIASVFRTRRVVTGEISYANPGGDTRYFEVVFSPVTGLGPRPEFVVGVSRDITDRKRRETQVALLADVGDDFARLTSPGDIMRVVGEKIYRHFGLDRLAFAYVDETADTVTSIHDRRSEGLPPAQGVLRLSNLVSDAFLRRLRTGQVYALDDIDTDPYAADRRDAFKALDAGALLMAPFVSEGEWRFVITLQKTEPYRWQQAEIDLVQELAPRLYLAIERARAGAAIRESEGRFRAVANLVPDLVWSTGPTGDITWCNQRLLDYTGVTWDDMVDLGWNGVIHRDDLAQANQEFFDAIAAGRPFHHEHRLRRHDGEYRWYLLRAEPIHDDAGRIVQWFGTATDIHDTRLVRDELARQVALATTELRTLSRQLIVVQEEERRHLARELHDEIGQALTALQLQLSAARRTPARKLAEAEAIVHELTGRVSALSMDLRPAALDTLGLIPALLWHSQRYEARTGVRVDLRHHGLIARLPPETEIAAYRVVQEALTNVARHAGVDLVTVQLLADDRLTIVIRDRGHGFDTAKTSAAGGLGGMRERVELLGGSFWIEAADGSGVVVTAEIPIDQTGQYLMENI